MKTLKLQPPEPKESEIQTVLIKRLRAAGWLVIRLNGTGFKDKRGQFVRSYTIYGLNASSGLPDVLALRGRGDYIQARLFEVKKRGGELTASQTRFINYAAHFGIGVVIVEGQAGLERVTAQMEG